MLIEAQIQFPLDRFFIFSKSLQRFTESEYTENMQEYGNSEKLLESAEQSSPIAREIKRTEVQQMAGQDLIPVLGKYMLSAEGMIKINLYK